MIQRTRRNGADLAVHARRLVAFFRRRALERRTRERRTRPALRRSRRSCSRGWRPRRGATRLDPHDVASARAAARRGSPRCSPTIGCSWSALTSGEEPSTLRVSSGLNAPLAQLDRASGYEPGGRRFESCKAHHLACASWFPLPSSATPRSRSRSPRAGSSPARRTTRTPARALRLAVFSHAASRSRSPRAGSSPARRTSSHARAGFPCRLQPRRGSRGPSTALPPCRERPCRATTTNVQSLMNVSGACSSVVMARSFRRTKRRQHPRHHVQAARRRILARG